jgi:16S rRNA (cytidine1402-2'-O)-methyltransferase
VPCQPTKVGTLYIVGAPAGDPEDFTARALRILGEVVLVITDDVDHAQRLLANCGLDTPLLASTNADLSPSVLNGGDVAILLEGWSPAPTGPSLQLVRAAIEQGLIVVPIPGPSLPLTALVISGLPADSFVYLGELPREPGARRDLMVSVAAERRTLVALASPRALPELMADLCEVFGDRPLALITASEGATGVAWRGTLGAVPEEALVELGSEACVLVIGGARGTAERWDEERLRAEVRRRVEQGLSAREIGRALAAESGWPRRAIYRLAARGAPFPPGGEPE